MMNCVTFIYEIDLYLDLNIRNFFKFSAMFQISYK